MIMPIVRETVDELEELTFNCVELIFSCVVLHVIFKCSYRIDWRGTLQNLNPMFFVLLAFYNSCLCTYPMCALSASAFIDSSLRQLDFFLDQLYSIYYLLPVLLSRQVIKTHTCRLAMWKVCLVDWNNLVSGLLSPGIPIYCCYGSFPCLCTIDVNYHETVIVYIKLPCLSIL